MRFIFLTALIASLTVSTAFGGKQAERERLRQWVRGQAESAEPHPVVEPSARDLARNLVDALQVTNLAEMQEKKLMKAELKTSPWSDSYWPTYAGQIANRYADPNFNAAMVWKHNYEYLTKNIGLGPDAYFSPAEKYDLLIGDANFGLTRRMINSGAPYADADGRVETWFGLCHGWAPASFMMSRPAKAITVKGADGRDLTFTPSDLKALATLLWSNGSGKNRFIGGRCNDRDVDRDENGRETKEDCFDTNPATWHMAAVNQIAISQRSFVMDVSSDFEVWNQPVTGYQYAYVNRDNGEWSQDLARAKVRIQDIKDDPYARFRSRKAAYIVKLAMSVSYLAEESPSTEPTNGPEDDSHSLVTFFYDLELDEKDEIVGGEWHGPMHPDFLWVPVKDSKAESYGDYWLQDVGDQSRWNPGDPIPASWQKAARLSSSRVQPLAVLVERLLELAR